jgi:hypothetical protein
MKSREPEKLKRAKRKSLKLVFRTRGARREIGGAPINPHQT